MAKQKKNLPSEVLDQKNSASQKNQEKLINFFKANLLPSGLFVLLFILIIITYKVVMQDKFYPQTFVGDTQISFLTQGQAIRKVESIFQKRKSQKLNFSLIKDNFTLDLATASATLDYSKMEEQFKKSHKNIFSFYLKSIITPKITFEIDRQLDYLSSLASQEPKNAELVFDETPSQEASASYRIQIKEGIDGATLDKIAIKKEVENFLLYGVHSSSVPLKIVKPKLTSSFVLKAKESLESLKDEPLKLVFEDKTWTIDIKQLLTLLNLENASKPILDKEKTFVFLEKIALEIDSEVQEGLFEFNPETKRVIAFKASQEGRKLNLEKTYQLITDSLDQKTINLPVEVVKPKIETSNVNNLGIKELLGRGVSNFAGSIPNRIYNVGLAASKVNGVLVPPGETFSFNKTVGDITAATGFKQAYVIKEGRTVLDDGGGVCQDSTTLFRAVLNAGLPIVKRTAHAYRVSYYEQGFPPGLDATVFYPSVDFQFKNDTQAHILIQAYVSDTTLYVDLYGTSDGRSVSLTKPVITSQTPPPPELRQDDPTIPKGTVKQVDWAAWGANVSFKRTVTKGEETLIDEVWRSNYKPWQAVYLVGTKEN